MDNLPLGAARDTRAPFNELPEREVSVTARAVLVKDTSVWSSEGHTCVEYEYDADTGRCEPVASWESDEEEEDLFRQQHRSPIEIIMCCERICRQLMEEGHATYASMSLSNLIYDCQDWDEIEFNV